MYIYIYDTIYYHMQMMFTPLEQRRQNGLFVCLSSRKTKIHFQLFFWTALTPPSDTWLQKLKLKCGISRSQCQDCMARYSPRKWDNYTKRCTIIDLWIAALTPLSTVSVSEDPPTHCRMHVTCYVEKSKHIITVTDSIITALIAPLHLE